MTTSEQLRELDKAQGAGGDILVSFEGGCPGPAAAVAERICAVLGSVLSRDEIAWEGDHAWRGELPAWFVGACADELSSEEAEQQLKAWRAMSPAEKGEYHATASWTLSNWLFSMSPRERQWSFWDCCAVGAHDVRVTVRVDSWPNAVGALEWLMRAAGANRVACDV